MLNFSPIFDNKNSYSPEACFIPPFGVFKLNMSLYVLICLNMSLNLICLKQVFIAKTFFQTCSCPSIPRILASGSFTHLIPQTKILGLILVLSLTTSFLSSSMCSMFANPVALSSKCMQTLTASYHIRSSDPHPHLNNGKSSPNGLSLLGLFSPFFMQQPKRPS